MLAAPTGKAAKRMTEATGHEAKTIHPDAWYTGEFNGRRRFHEKRNEHP